MMRSIASLFVASALLLLTACAQSLHQGERLGFVDAHMNPGYPEPPSYWNGPGFWWNPFGYYGSGYGWYGGGSGGGSQQSNAPAPRPTPPTNAPPQFQKKY